MQCVERKFETSEREKMALLESSMRQIGATVPTYVKEDGKDGKDKKEEEKLASNPVEIIKKKEKEKREEERIEAKKTFSLETAQRLLEGKKVQHKRHDFIDPDQMRYNAPKQFRYTEDEKKGMCIYNEDFINKLKKRHWCLKGREN